MKDLPKLDKSVISIDSLDSIGDENEHWRKKSTLERLRAIEINRRMVYGTDRATSRLQRFFEVAQRS